ncbi:hypothetical protein NHL50_14085 [Acidimicrobiia bacterium EGI L10123]|uniref:hypothetical protein n=1 Tax=Salinilacustrithrix flava TaxID=2957203 RepID=UPI003D7C2FC4|nr:hypothetical protein [Acidimicrobiia bacterium EGI L10123]
MTEPLDPLAADEVLRRAAEISAQDRPVPAHGGYDRRALTEAASEVGIARGAVELALAEHDAGILVHSDARGGLLGPSRVLETRVVPRTVPESRGHVIHWLRSQLLHRDERQGTAEVWRPRDDLGAKLRRKVDARTARRVRLGDVDAVEVSVVDCGEGRSLVRLEVVFDDMRRGLRTGVVVVPAAVTPVLGVAAAVLTQQPELVFISLPVAGALGAVGTVAGRKTLADQRERARRALCSFLDGLEEA